MPGEFPEDNPQDLWQQQSAEPFTMSADLIRYKAQQRRAKARLETLAVIATGCILSVLFGLAALRAGETVVRAGWGVLSLWCIYFSYHTYRWLWPGSIAAGAELAVSLEFYRNQLERRRDYGRHIWRRSGLPFCLLGLALVLVPALSSSVHNPRVLLNAAPFFVLLIVWAVAFAYQRKAQRREIEQDLEELRAFERGNRP